MRLSFDVGLIIPMREEFDSAREILDFGDPIVVDRTMLHPFSVPGSSVTGVAVVLFGIGQTTSAAAAARLLALSSVRVLALSGIAGALNAGLRLGDVVVASAVDEYLHGAKATAKAARGTSYRDLEFEVGGISWRAGPEIVGYAENFRYLPDAGSGFTSWQVRAKARRVPVIAAAIPEFARDLPDYQVGAIATGSIVSAAAPFAEWLLRHNRFRMAVEMEAAGAAEAVYQDGRPDLLIVRGISDFSDQRKDDLDASAAGTAAGIWRHYAAVNAIDLFAALIANPRFPWPPKPEEAEESNDGEPRPRIAMTAHVSGDGRAYQAGRDQRIGGE